MAAALTYDKVDVNGVADDPCQTVPLSGYLREGVGDHDRLYVDRTFRSWIEIPRESIAAQTLSDEQDEPMNGRSVVWVMRDATVVRCKAVLASEFDGQTRSSGEDLGQWAYPR